LDERLINNGFVRLGVANWEADNAYGGGIPKRELAVAYAQAIGASVVIYTTHPATDKYNYSEHYVGFYARQHGQRATPNTRPSNAQASFAMDRLQDALGKPHVKGGVWYDRATDIYNWIGPKFRRHMSEPASQFLYEVGRYLE
jgi:hypothetical protein